MAPLQLLGRRRGRLALIGGLRTSHLWWLVFRKRECADCFMASENGLESIEV